jgi:DNA helicase-2/ATP-dependent DNA helicase PcrA
MLILAGAGSGKTRTLTYSVAKLIQSGVDPHQIMLVTFTNKAAEEMMKRVKELLGKMPPITAGTFHAIANRFLKRFSHKIKFPNYAILNDYKSKQLYKKCIDDACVNELNTSLEYNRLDNKQKDERYKEIKKSYPKAKKIQEIVSSIANTGKSLPKVIDWKYRDFSEKFEQINEIMNRYRTIKEKEILLDFDDLLFFWEAILDYDDVKAYAMQYKYILVDEFQDTNYVQNKIVKKIVELNSDHCLLAVGDDYQSIYAFRGADVSNFLNFEKNFPESKVYKITKNYRSTPEILSVANDSIGNNKHQFLKKMTTTKSSGEEVKCVVTKDYNSQIDFLLAKIKELRQMGVVYEEIAVLCRALKGRRSEDISLNKLMIKLTEANIPFEVRGGYSFFEKAHIRDIFAFLEYRFNPFNIFAKENWSRITKNYVHGLGKTNSDKIYEEILKSSENPLFILREKQILTKALNELTKRKKMRKLKPEVINSVSRIFTRLLSDAGSNVGDIIKNLMNFPPIFKSFETMHKSGEEDESFDMRKEEIKLIIQMATEFKTIDEFINHFSLHESEINDTSKAKGNKSKLIISTIHRAKGLEWDYVFIPMLSNGYFPDFYSLEIEEELEEERRVFYVASTRARTNLLLLTSKKNDKKKTTHPSQFLEELSSNLVELIERE